MCTCHVCVCRCVCTCGCVCVCGCVHACVCVYTCVHLRKVFVHFDISFLFMRLPLRIRLPLRLPLRIGVCHALIPARVCMCVHVRVCMCVCVCVHVCMCMHYIYIAPKCMLYTFAQLRIFKHMDKKHFKIGLRRSNHFVASYYT